MVYNYTALGVTVTSSLFLCRPLKSGLIFMGDSLWAKLLILNSVGYSYLPWHDCPSPVYPSLQVQIWEPFVLLQFELTWQTWLPLLHSLTSVNKNQLPNVTWHGDKHWIFKFNGESFFFYFWETLFCYLLGRMHWLYLGMNARLQCILPYRRRYKSRQC